MSSLRDRFDVAVIGAGPAGSMAAKYAAKSGGRTLLLEEHPAVGWPVECAGLRPSENGRLAAFAPVSSPRYTKRRADRPADGADAGGSSPP